MTYAISSGKIVKARKIVLYGPEGIGKSTFASKMPNPLFIDTEGSTGELNVRRLPAPTSWRMLEEEIRQVTAEPDCCKTLVIDTADWAEILCTRSICDEKSLSGIEDMGYGKGYVYLAEKFGGMLNLLSDVTEKNVNVLLTAHAMMRKFEQPDEMGAYDRWELKLQKKTAALVKEWADMLLFANYETVVVNVDNQGALKGKNKVQGGRRMMFTTHHPCWDAKNRVGLPEKTDFDAAVILPYLPSFGTAAVRNSDERNDMAAISSADDSPGGSTTAYWHAPKFKTVMISETGNEYETFAKDPDIEQIDEAEYLRLKRLYAEETKKAKAAAEAPPAEADSTRMIAKHDGDVVSVSLPKALTDLMAANGVGEDEIRRAVHAKGYYPRNMPVSDYDPGFIDGVLVGAWEQVFGLIREQRQVAENFS